MKSIIWITWEKQRRNLELSKALGIKLFEFKEIDDIKNSLKKYAIGIYRTIRLLLTEKPALVYCQNPSVILATLMILVRYVSRIHIIIDAHNRGIFPLDGKSKFWNWISRIIQRSADLTLVTNKALKQYVENNHGRAFILPDKIPELPYLKRRDLKGKNNFLFICSFGDDEPFEEVFHAAAKLDLDTCIYVTGNYTKKHLQLDSLPQNIIMLGYLSDQEYVEMLYSVDATIDLTTRENCLVCGAYESLAVEKPVSLSDTQAIRTYFDTGVVYSKNTAVDLINAMRLVISTKKMLRDEIKVLKEKKIKEWNILKDQLLAFQNQLLKTNN